MQGAAVTVTDLACRRGDRILFHGLSARLEPGQAMQVTGSNGIGKSSLLRILAGLAPSFAGSAQVTGAVGLLDERPALDLTQPLGRALGFWRKIDGPAEEQLDRLGLSELLDVPVRFLSTGQKKRAAIARLLGQQARIWLLDEPLNGLDGHAVALAETVTAEHCEAGGIAVIASHQPFNLAGMRTLALAEYAR